MSTPHDRADALYGLSLDQFVPERDALAKALRAEGDRTGADEVRRLPKPTRPAWTVNTTVREHPEAVRELAASARLLAEAQQELLAGGDAAALREAGERARAAIDALVAAAPESSDATTDKMRETLQAATVDPDVLAEVTSGRLAHERVASGFGAPAAAGAGRGGGSRTRSTKKGATGRTTTARPEARKEQARAAAARDEARRREKLRRAKEAEAAAEHDVAGARRALEQVESAMTERRAEAREAEARLKDARRRRERIEKEA